MGLYAGPTLSLVEREQADPPLRAAREVHLAASPGQPAPDERRSAVLYIRVAGARRDFGHPHVG